MRFPAVRTTIPNWILSRITPVAKQKKEVAEEPLEKQLWKTADKLRKNIDAAEYKHIVLGLIFLKDSSDSFV